MAAKKKPAGASGAQGRKPRGPVGYGTSKGLKGGGFDYSITVKTTKSGGKEVMAATQRGGPAGRKKLEEQVKKVASSKSAGLRNQKLSRKDYGSTEDRQGAIYVTGSQNPSSRNKKKK